MNFFIFFQKKWEWEEEEKTFQYSNLNPEKNGIYRFLLENHFLELRAFCLLRF